MPGRHILVLDDDPQIRKLLTDYLGDAGFVVGTASSGAAFEAACRGKIWDLVIFDLLLPDCDGIDLIRDFKSVSDTPIVILTTRSDDVDRILGLEIGADDYVSKPFVPRELLARIRSIFRRIDTSRRLAQAKEALHLRVAFADWQLDLATRRLCRNDGREARLTNSEFQLLSAFVERPRHVLNREQLLEYSRRDPEAVFDRTIDYLVLRLRRKLEEDSRHPELIKTEYGAGYVFTPEVHRC